MCIMMPARVCLMRAMAILLACAGGARAQQGVAARARETEAQGHGWMVLNEARVGAPATMLHLPPRGGVGAGQWGASRGIVVAAVAFDRVPARMTAWDDEAFVAMPRVKAEGEPGMWEWGIQRVRARAVGRMWLYPPGRPEALATLKVEQLPGSEEPYLAGFGAGRRELSALVAPRERPSADGSRRSVDWGSSTLWVLVGGAWHEGVLPWKSVEGERTPGAHERVLMAGGTEGPSVCVVREGAVRVWQGRVMRAGPEMVGPPELVSWEAKDLTAPAGATLGPARWLVCVPNAQGSGSLVIATGAGEGGARAFVLWAIDGATGMLRRVGEYPETEDGSVGVIAGASSSGPVVAYSWLETPGVGEAGAGVRRRMLREISIDSGRELYSGASLAGRTLVTNQYRILAIGLVAMTAVVLVYVLRREQPALELPKSLVPAGGFRRMIAGAIDGASGVALAALAVSEPMETLLDPRAYLTGQVGIGEWLIVVGCAAGLCTVGEAILGQSIGKAITGCAVIDLRVSPGKASAPQVWQALVRNVVRWAVPPLGVLVFLDRDGRHLGDVWAQTVVVTMEIPEDGEDGEDPDSGE